MARGRTGKNRKKKRSAKVLGLRVILQGHKGGESTFRKVKPEKEKSKPLGPYSLLPWDRDFGREKRPGAWKESERKGGGKWTLSTGSGSKRSDL